MAGNRILTSAAPALLLVLAVPAHGQGVNLDSATPDGKVFVGKLGTADSPAVFRIALPPRQGLELEALPIGESDPVIKVFDGTARQPMAENDDRPGTVAARVRLYSETAKTLRVEVSASPSGPELEPNSGFRLVVLPTDYRPSPVRDLAAGGRQTGEIDAGDEQLYRFRAESGQMWVLNMTVPEGSRLDPMLEVYAGETTSGTALASDDDGGGELNSRLRFRVPRPGTYTVRATSAARGGAYALTAAVEPAGAVVTGGGELSFDRTVSGRIDDENEEQLYRLSEAARRQISGGVGSVILEMTATSDEFDPQVEVGFETPLGFSAVSSDDDGGGGLNAKLTVDLSGFQSEANWLERLRIRAKSAIGNEGEYELSLSRAP